METINLLNTRSRYLKYIDSCMVGNDFKLTNASDTSPYALCFAIFGYNFLNEIKRIQSNAEAWDSGLRKNIFEKRKLALHNNSLFAKEYLQLLTFTLSALSVLGTLKNDPLEELIIELLPDDVSQDLTKYGCLDGIAQSGNHAMFLCILLIHAKQYLNIDTTKQINDWEKAHLNSMNKRGFWGNSHTMSYLEFQNGYHQYEIFKYLNTENVPWDSAAYHISKLADELGHFAPYPGGGGCYDFDAIFFLTHNKAIAKDYESLLALSFQSIVSEQNTDGGFAESLYVRPRSLQNINYYLRNILRSSGKAKLEQIRRALTIQRPKNNKIHTHWTFYSRSWHESNLWDSWFRLMALARIETVLETDQVSNWNFIEYPGIGFFGKEIDS